MRPWSRRSEAATVAAVTAAAAAAAARPRQVAIEDANNRRLVAKYEVRAASRRPGLLDVKEEVKSGQGGAAAGGEVGGVRVS